MENASKALIIAGAILLSILLITLGIIVYRQAAGVMDNNAMDETAVTTFNEKFQQYAGENVRGTQVNSLLNTVKQNNLSNSGDSSKQVTVTYDANGSNWSGTKNETGKALTGKSYAVTCTPDTKSGYITTITISDAK
mgnify:CR=1 FL=1